MKLSEKLAALEAQGQAGKGSGKSRGGRDGRVGRAARAPRGGRRGPAVVRAPRCHLDELHLRVRPLGRAPVQRDDLLHLLFAREALEQIVAAKPTADIDAEWGFDPPEQLLPVLYEELR